MHSETSSISTMPNDKSSEGIMKGDKGNRLAVFQVSRVSCRSYAILFPCLVYYNIDKSIAGVWRAITASTAGALQEYCWHTISVLIAHSII